MLFLITPANNIKRNILISLHTVFTLHDFSSLLTESPSFSQTPGKYFPFPTDTISPCRFTTLTFANTVDGLKNNPPPFLSSFFPLLFSNFRPFWLINHSLHKIRPTTKYVFQSRNRRLMERIEIYICRERGKAAVLLSHENNLMCYLERKVPVKVVFQRGFLCFWENDFGYGPIINLTYCNIFLRLNVFLLYGVPKDLLQPHLASRNRTNNLPH